MNISRPLRLFASIALAAIATLHAQTLYVPGGTVGSTSNGNVGVGTNSPGAPLQVGSGNSAIEIGNFGSTARANSSLRADANGSLDICSGSGGVVSFGYDTRTAVTFWGNSGINAVFQPGGNVGIGTTNPGSRLEVYNGTIRLNGSSTLSGYGGVEFANVSGFGLQTASLNYDFRAANGATSRLFINDSGNVGIGTTSPHVRLEVADSGGAYQIGTNSSYWSGFKTTAPAGFWGFQQNERAFFGVGGNLYNLGFSTNAIGIFNGSTTAEDIYLCNKNGPDTGYLVVKASGNVGIGTTNPTQKLSVNGTVRAKEVIVDAGWSDYVFDQGYKLKALSEVEAYVKAEKHLPGIPSAQEVADHGISVGEMQSKLLAKIEELTLHQIEQEKRSDAQERRLAEQSRRIAQLETENAALRTAP